MGRHHDVGSFFAGYKTKHHAAGALSKFHRSLVNKEEVDWSWPTVAEFLMREELEEELEKIGFTEEAREKAADLFYEAVQSRLNNHDPFRQALAELLNDYCPSPFMSNEQLSVVEMLANKVMALQDDIEYIQNENAQLSEEIQQSLQEVNNNHYSKA